VSVALTGVMAAPLIRRFLDRATRSDAD
jgi:hypothetical protein